MIRFANEVKQYHKGPTKHKKTPKKKKKKKKKKKAVNSHESPQTTRALKTSNLESSIVKNFLNCLPTFLENGVK